MPLPEHGVTTVFVELDNTKLELLEVLGEKSPISVSTIIINKHELNYIELNT